MAVRYLFCVLAALFSASVNARAAENPDGVTAALDFSHATSLTAAPVGDRVAWVNHYRGVRNVWVAEGPEWEGRVITAYEADDGPSMTAGDRGLFS